jgi:hypothetical protein
MGVKKYISKVQTEISVLKKTNKMGVFKMTNTRISLDDCLTVHHNITFLSPT